MGSSLIQILVLAGVALFLVLRLRDVLGTRDGFEKPLGPEPKSDSSASNRNFEVIDGGGVDRDIADHVEQDSDTGRALQMMKRADAEFSVSEFAHGARQAYEMILMAYENGELDTLQQFLAPEVYESFSSAVFARADQGLTVDASFVGIRELKITGAEYHEETREGDITVRFVGELTSVVRNPDGEVVEGDPSEIKRQKDVWTFSRVMGSDNPNWLLVGTGG
ncbi:MAG: Tim44/TimA family putative adaptor protein [Pseudomonadota bacterium]